MVFKIQDGRRDIKWPPSDIQLLVWSFTLGTVHYLCEPPPPPAEIVGGYSIFSKTPPPNFRRKNRRPLIILSEKTDTSFIRVGFEATLIQWGSVRLSVCLYSM